MASVEDSKGEDNESASSVQSKVGPELGDSEHNDQSKKDNKLPSIDMFFSTKESDSCKLIGRKRPPESLPMVLAKKIKEDDCSTNPAEALQELFFKRARGDVWAYFNYTIISQ